MKQLDWECGGENRMIDLSITKDPKWIKAREKLWKPIGKRIAEDLRKDELEGVHHYFMTGQELPGHPMGDGASISWFPILCNRQWWVDTGRSITPNARTLAQLRRTKFSVGRPGVGVLINALL